MNSNTALIGAPNRDHYYSGVNGGGAFFFDLGYLNVRFSAREYVGCRALTVRSPMTRCGFSCAATIA